MRYVLLYSFLISYLFSFSQTQIWSDDFEATTANWNLTIQSGLNNPNSNIWEISDDEGGVLPPNCAVNSNNNKTLHVTCMGGDCGPLGSGARYYPGDMGGANPGNTNIRAALIAGISTVGETQLQLDFDWMGVGQANVDFAALEYSVDAGATWTVLWSQTPGPVCGGDGQWSQQSVTLPTATENQSDLRFAFNWTNDNDGAAIAPSFAVNNLSLVTTVAPPGGPTADFTSTSFTICEDDCVNFIDMSVGTNISSWTWSFNGANTLTSSSQNPTNICWSTAGTYNVKLTVTDDNGTDDVTYQIIIENCDVVVPTAAFSTDTLVICAGDCIDFTDESEGNPTLWNWDFDGGSPGFATTQNPSNVCFNQPGTYDISLTVSNSAGTDQVITPITVLDLPTVTTFGDTIIAMGGAAGLIAIPNQQSFVLWEPNEDIDCDTCIAVIATPVITTTYYSYVTDFNGCVGYDSVTVHIAFEEIVDVPSAFSPNNDGQNDKLRVLGIGIAEIDFKIFNRYGQLVFSTTDLEEGWDGKLNGEPLNQGVFVYTLSYTLIDGTTSEISGNVTLVK
ncbi:T9SS type B sorting domain-containing protein [Brumimicrobium glaciale]|uniref:T9SS type B sorting domain-containing protein n=1 Tax=Brumimicrobium glaciale TaxID=200475 RepID=A0A4Q4KG14_9FLAO|nr:PKD domain-containing protein [Brumimicrobium glaciale]RYM32061.1 T9SS type B sorting domain-containing protein [Brumimicrobium glaciale]